MRPALADMLTFLEVVEARSFTGAAEALGRTRSAVSQAVQRLEGDIGARLLYRSTRALTLTEAGTQLAGRCRSIKASYDEALEDLETASEKVAGLMTVTAPHALCASFVAPAIARYLARNPDLRLRLIADDARIDLIEAQIDLAIRVARPEGQSARVAKLGAMSESLYAHPTYISGRGGLPADLKELADWRHIANDWQGTPITYRFTDGTAVTIEPHIRCNAFPQVLAFAAAALGLARLPDSAAGPEVTAGRLANVAAIGSSDIYAMHQYDKRPPPKVRGFIATLRESLRAGSGRG